MHKQRVAILVIAAVGMLSSFINWVEIPMLGGLNGTKLSLKIIPYLNHYISIDITAGWLTLLAFAFCAILTFIGNKQKTMKYALISTLPALAASGLGLAILVCYKHAIESTFGGGDNLFSEMFEATFSVGFGLYLIIFLGFAMPVATIITRK